MMASPRIRGCLVKRRENQRGAFNKIERVVKEVFSNKNMQIKTRKLKDHPEDKKENGWKTKQEKLTRHTKKKILKSFF